MSPNSNFLFWEHTLHQSETTEQMCFSMWVVWNKCNAEQCKWAFKRTGGRGQRMKGPLWCQHWRRVTESHFLLSDLSEEKRKINSCGGSSWTVQQQVKGEQETDKAEGSWRRAGLTGHDWTSPTNDGVFDRADAGHRNALGYAAPGPSLLRPTMIHHSPPLHKMMQTFTSHKVDATADSLAVCPRVWWFRILSVTWRRPRLLPLSHTSAWTWVPPGGSRIKVPRSQNKPMVKGMLIQYQQQHQHQHLLFKDFWICCFSM